MDRIYGRKSVLETIDSDQKILKAYILENPKTKRKKDPLISKIIEKLREKNVDIYMVDKEFFNKIEGNHQGVMIEVESFKYKSLEEVKEKAQRLVILDQLEDPHNLGAIIRSAEALGFDGVIIPERRSVKVTSTVYKTSAGAINNIDVIMVKNITRAIKDLQKENFWIYGLAGEAEQSLEEVDLRGKIALVVGNEGTGISRLVRETCDKLVKIPMTGRVNSLNASVAAAISFYEVAKQNGFN
jgi:23S rRNA (guanosine2251-2'-O)-methyltransferase